jgi:hypothetical protein
MASFNKRASSQRGYQRYRGVQQPAGAVANARLYTPGGTGGAGDQIDPQYPTFGLIR